MEMLDHLNNSPNKPQKVTGSEEQESRYVVSCSFTMVTLLWREGTGTTNKFLRLILKHIQIFPAASHKKEESTTLLSWERRAIEGKS